MPSHNSPHLRLAVRCLRSKKECQSDSDDKAGPEPNLIDQMTIEGERHNHHGYRNRHSEDEQERFHST